MCSETNALGVQEIKVKPGYKMTELGVIPEDWEVSNLGDIADFFKGKGLPKSDIVTGGKYKCIHYGELFTKYKEYITEIKSYTNNKDNVFLSKENDVLMPTSDVTPNGLATASCISQNNVILGGDVLVIRNNSNNLHGVYFSYNITQNKPRVMKLVSGTTVYHLYGSDMKNYQFLLPTNINEQKLIAQTLSDTDELINSLDELIVKKEKIKEGTMQELLTGKRRLPGFNGEWEEKNIGKLCDYQNGTALEKFFNTSKGYKVISIGNYSPEGIYIDTNSYIDKSISEVKKFVLNKGELTMILNDKTSVGTIIGRVLLIDKDDDYVFNQRTMRLKTKNLIDSKFLYYKINGNEIHSKIVKLAKPGTQIYINTNDVLDLEILYPTDINEQKAIAEVLLSMDNEIENLKTKRDKYIKIKEGMMQELLTGKTRLV